MLTLYQFPISHYCEKARWALDYKGLPYRAKNLLPGPHVKAVRKMAPRSTVPVLVHDGRVVQNSADIITYLDETFPDRGLTPADQVLKQEALDWEAYVDTEIGIHLRRMCYHTLLDHPSITISFLTADGPWYGPLLIRLIYPKLSAKMRKLMKISDATARESEEHVRAAVDRIFAHRQDRVYLVGEAFSRADLAAAALLAPICRPDGYGLDWPEALPEPLQGIADSLAPKLEWVTDLYRQFRRPPA